MGQTAMPRHHSEFSEYMTILKWYRSELKFVNQNQTTYE
jgi:hypothetical protein